MPRPDKAAAVEAIRQELERSQAALLTEYRGLTVPQLKELRRALAADAAYVVVKNTLAKIAVRQEGVAGLDGVLTGPTAIAYVAGDPVQAAKVLRDFAKAHHALVVKGAIMDGRALSAEDVGKLADLDSREVTLAKLAGVVKAALFQAAYMFAAPAAQAARAIDALRQEQDKQETAAAQVAPTSAAG
ncbi:MAG: 50S ribosomal protein L10 [Bifidobacteriaceae bacterium]|jgi:large subunit ribosomal protein L10|nr:50S ribosomal protein L10 [Bifidobacteriaceae bacterium]